MIEKGAKQRSRVIYSLVKIILVVQVNYGFKICLSFFKESPFTNKSHKQLRFQ